MRIGVSQRHVSFVESGRAKPSRGLLVNWLRELNAPLGTQNAAMWQAGYSPIYSHANIRDPALAHATAATMQLLQSHDPMPAFVIDAQWNLINLNRGGEWLAATLIPWSQPLLASVNESGAAPINMIDMLCHPEGFTRHLLNFDEVGPSFLAHLREDASAIPSLAPKVQAFAALLRSRLGFTDLQSGATRQSNPVLVSRFDTSHGELAFFSMFTTFGTPQDITLASLRVEHMFAANDATRQILNEQVTLQSLARQQ